MKVSVDRTSKVDWVSFSFQSTTTDQVYDGWFDDVLYDLEKKSETASALLHADEPKLGGGRRPYSESYGNRFCTLYFSPVMEWSLFEISGTGCALLEEYHVLNQLISDTRDRITRIDIATDLLVGETNRVQQFINAGYSDRFKSKSHVSSTSGETYYIGSRQSERLCRVYQYNAPHPRHQNLRVEIELKGDRAKQCAGLLLEKSVEQVADALADVYQFESPLWSHRSSHNVTFEAIRGKQQQNATVAWFHRQVVPAFHRMVDEGQIDDPIQWLMDVFINSQRKD